MIVLQQDGNSIPERLLHLPIILPWIIPPGEKELSQRHEHELLIQDITNQVQNKEEQSQMQQEEKGRATAAGKQAEADLAAASESLKADTTSLADTKSQCKLAAQEWTARKASAEQEMATIVKAVDILSGKFGFFQKSSFLQRSSARKDISEKEWENRLKASAVLRKLSRNYNSFRLMQVATAAQDDPFVKVRALATVRYVLAGVLHGGYVLAGVLHGGSNHNIANQIIVGAHHRYTSFRI